MAEQARRSSVSVRVEYGTYTESSDGKKTYAKVKDLKNVSDIPDLGGTPEQIDVTAIGDDRRKFIAGIIEQDELEFTCFYEKEIFKELQALGPIDNGGHAVKISILGDEDKVEVDVTVYGTISVALAGFGVGDAINYTMRVAVADLEFGPKQDA